MLRFYCLLLLACLCGYAAPISVSTTANCPGTSVTGTWSAGCGAGAELGNAGAQASVVLTADKIRVFAVAMGDNSYSSKMWSAQAGFSADYLLTFTGGTGSGMFKACIYAWADHYPGDDSGSSSGSFGLVHAAISNKLWEDSCYSSDLFNHSWAPFTFGVPQVVHAAFGASAYSGTRSAGPGMGDVLLTGFLIDLDGTISPGTYSLSLVDVPEPASATAVLAGLTVIAAFGVAKRKPTPRGR